MDEIDRLLNAWADHIRMNGAEARGALCVRNYRAVDAIVGKLIDSRDGKYNRGAFRWSEPDGSQIDICVLESRHDLLRIRGMVFTFIGLHGRVWPGEWFEQLRVRLQGRAGLALQMYQAGR